MRPSSLSVSRLDAAQLTRLDEKLQAGEGALRLASDDADLLEPILDEWTRLHELALKFRTAHPELIQMMFGNYTKLVYQAQTNDPALDAKAQDCAARLGLAYERRFTGYGDLATEMARVANTAAKA